MPTQARRPGKLQPTRGRQFRQSRFTAPFIFDDPVGGDTTPPVVTITVSPSLTKISGVTGKDVTVLTFEVDEACQAWKAKRVADQNAAHTTGDLIESGGAISALTPVQFDVTKAELDAAFGVEGTNVIKIFTQDSAGNWSE